MLRFWVPDYLRYDWLKRKYLNISSGESMRLTALDSLQGASMQISTISIINFQECVSELNRGFLDQSASMIYLLRVNQKVEDLTDHKQNANWGILQGSVAVYPLGRSGSLIRVENFSFSMDDEQLGYGASLIVLDELYELTGRELFKKHLEDLIILLDSDFTYNYGALQLYKIWCCSGNRR